jgi:hypothetical protein
MQNHQESLSDERAVAIIRRATQLQAEAAQREEDRSGALSDGSSAEAGIQLTQAQLETAAAEAGIDPVFIRLALAEGADSAVELRAWERWLARFALRNDAVRSTGASRSIPATPAEVLAAMRRVLPKTPYRLSFLDSVGDPLSDGILLFEIPAVSWSATLPLAYHASGVSLRRLAFTLESTGTADAPCTEVTVTGDLRKSVRQGGQVAGVLFTVIGGAAGLVAGLATIPLLGPGAVAAGAAGLALVGGGGLRGYGKIYGYYLRRLQEDLELLLVRIGADARTRGLFPPAEPGAAADGGFDARDSLQNAIS